MCLTIYNNNITTFSLAEEDIVAYKIYRRINDRYFAPFRDVSVPKNKLLPEVKFDINSFNRFTMERLLINKGYHSIINESEAISVAKIMTNCDADMYKCHSSFYPSKVYSARYHHILNHKKEEVSYVVMKVTIPKGTEYFEGMWNMSVNSIGSYASTQLVLGEVIFEILVTSFP